MPLDPLALIARALPDKLAVVDDRPDGRVTRASFAELNRDVNRLANALRRAGVGAGTKVVWCGMNSLGVVQMMSAARKVGATAVPLNYRLSADEAAFVVDDCDAELVWVDAESAALIAEIRARVPKVRHFVVFNGPAPAGMQSADEFLAGASDEEHEREDSDAPAATMIYTSGTTGRPKGAVRKGIGDPEQVRKLIAHIGYVPDDVYLTTGPLYHSGPGGFMNVALMLSNTIVLQRKFDPADWLRLVERYRVSTTFSAPTPIRMVCTLPEEVRRRYDVSSMKRMIANAAPWSFALKELYMSCFGDDSLFEVYGSTELGVNTVLRPEDQRRKPGSCGRPSPGVEIALFDDDGRRVGKPHEPGELFVRSASVFDTYYKAHEKFEADRRDGWQTVGDVAYYDEEGFYYICDRKKDMIISGGMNIYPAEIEAALEQHEDVLDVAVFGIPSEEWGESVHAVVVLHAGRSIEAEKLLAYARKHLASYKVPRSITFAPELPRTGSGKILKRQLREPFWQGRTSRV
jgi:fatty-acyl-CoA synthase/long-chain acyl-CoA synthetase